LEGVRSSVFSALAGHPIPTVGNQIRAGIRLASLFKALGIEGLNTDYDPQSLPDKAVELLMRTLPFRHIYDSPVARRIYFVYGDVFEYENINRPTMDAAVPGFFGNGNITFEHISLMISASAAVPRRHAHQHGRIVDADRLLTGENKRMFKACVSQRRTTSWRATIRSTPTTFDDYAHLDLWLGTNAERDTFPPPSLSWR
jgi:cholesterol oxidase